LQPARFGLPQTTSAHHPGGLQTRPYQTRY
jgi:hypothetical protein